MRMKMFARTCALLCALLLISPTPLALAQQEMTVLTIGGAGVTPNRAPQPADAADMFGFHEISFENGYALTRADLAALPQYEHMKPLQPAEGADVAATVMQTFSGPRIMDVLKLAGAQADTVTAYGFDGFAAEITVADLLDHNGILAITLNGAPLDLGGRGPSMVVFAPAADPETAQRLSDREVWAVFYIEVE